MNEEIVDLKKNIFNRAKIFIEDMGCFTPFGAKIQLGKIIDLIAYENFQDTIDGVVLIDLLKKSLINDFNRGLITAGAVAYDVVINYNNSDGVVEKRDALCLIITQDGDNWSEEYYPYMLIDNECIWK